MAKFISRSIVVALALTGAVSAAQAAPVTYNFTADLFSLSEQQQWGFEEVASADLGSNHLALGDKLVGSITYDPADAEFVMDGDPNGAPGTNYLYNLPKYTIEYTTLSGGYSFSSTFAFAETVNGTSDVMRFDSYARSTSQDLNLIARSVFSFWSDDNNWLSSATLPTSLNASFPGLTSGLLGSLRTEDFGAIINFSANVTSISPAVSAVPEPSTYAMLLAGLGLLSVAARRQRRNDSV